VVLDVVGLGYPVTGAPVLWLTWVEVLDTVG